MLYSQLLTHADADAAYADVDVVVDAIGEANTATADAAVAA